MTPVETDEKQLLADVEALRSQFPNTLALYVEVCALLFFRYGVTPTTNRLYQLVRRGSMSVPGDALRQFWGTLREKSRVKIEHPDLPEALTTAAAESLAGLWTLARQTALEGLEASRAEAAEQVRAAQEAARDDVAAADADRARQVALLEIERQRADGLSAKLAEREAAYSRLADQRTAEHADHVRQLATVTQAEAVAASERDVARRDLAAAQADSDRIHAAFTDQLDKFRADSAASEARHVALEHRALLDLDQERQRASRMTKQLDQVQTRLNETLSEHARSTALLQTQIGNFQSRVGELEGRLAAAKEEGGRWQAACERLQNELAEQRAAERAREEEGRAVLSTMGSHLKPQIAKSVSHAMTDASPSAIAPVSDTSPTASVTQVSSRTMSLVVDSPSPDAAPSRPKRSRKQP